ncbi:MAG: hypothetical protein ACPG4X_15645 [Pikeienuella sp.]
MDRITITDHALERYSQRFGVKCRHDSLASILWAYPIVRTGVEMAEQKPIEDRFTEWPANIQRENIKAVFRRNAVVTVYPISEGQ